MPNVVSRAVTKQYLYRGTVYSYHGNGTVRVVYTQCFVLYVLGVFEKNLTSLWGNALSLECA